MTDPRPLHLRFNLLYWLLPALAFLAVWLFRDLNASAGSFYGVAENRDMDINVDQDIRILSVHVQAGQLVKKGSLLLQAERRELAQKLQELEQETQRLNAEQQKELETIRGKVRLLSSERTALVSRMQEKIRLAENRRDFFRWIAREMHAGRTATFATDSLSLSETEIRSLQEQLAAEKQTLDTEIASLQASLQTAGKPYAAQMARARSESDYLVSKQQQLTLYAPADGQIGLVNCKAGEHKQAFESLLSFYLEHPSSITAFVPENQSLQWKPGDSLRVTSFLHPALNCKGSVQSLGNRIIEIPERLRKFPEIKTYGREIVIAIPAENPFLQKEKVRIERLVRPGKQ